MVEVEQNKRKTMKKTIIFASVALATLFAFSSCQKESLQDNESTNGVRIITAEFENNATKTELNDDDGKTPEWAVGDVLRVLSATSYQDVTLAAGDITDNKITFTTTLTGTLYAVYPASATTMESCGDGNISFTIPAIQDGSFASANICVAKSSTTDETNKNNLVFRNATSVLEFSQTAATTQVLSVRVEAANAIVGPMSVSFKADGTLDDPTTSSLSGQLIRVKSSEAKDKYYIAAAPVATGRIEFEYQKVVEVATVTTEAGKTLAANKIYACPSMDGETYEVKTGSINGHDYVQIGSLKWATMNIGATETNNYGDYFMWGYTVGHTAATNGSGAFSGQTFKDASRGDDTKGFVWDNYIKFTSSTYSSSNKKVFTKYIPSGEASLYGDQGTFYDNKSSLDPEDDAAHVIWGSTWRIPTGGDNGEFVALRETTYWNWEDGGYYVYDPADGDEGGLNGKKANNYTSVTGSYDKEDALLFFPAAGAGDDAQFDGSGNNASLRNAGNQGHYWSSTPQTSNSVYAYGLYFQSNSVNSQNGNPRCYGRTVRPVSD